VHNISGGRWSNAANAIAVTEYIPLGQIDTKAELETVLTDVANILEDDVAETLTANWVNTANPWADNEVVNALTVDDAGIAATITRDSELVSSTNALDVALRALTNTAGSVNNSGNTFIQDAILDANGNITNWVSAAASTAIPSTITNVATLQLTNGFSIDASTALITIITNSGDASSLLLGHFGQAGGAIAVYGTNYASSPNSAGDLTLYAYGDKGDGGEIDFNTDTTLRMSLLADGTLNFVNSTVASNAQLHGTSGATVNEFSIDGTLAGNSDAAVPTEKAVKTYVDAAGGGGDPAAWWYATMSADMLNITASAHTPIVYDTIAQTNGCNYNTSTYTATNIPNGVYMFRLQVRIEDFDTQKWGNFVFNPVGGFPLTALNRYNEAENQTADLQNMSHTAVYVVTNGNGACYPTWYSGDTANDNDIATLAAYFSGIKIHDYP
jgi:hypothetical protein